MPTEKPRLLETVPDEDIPPHLALYDGATGMATGIPPGSALAVVVDPTKAEGVLPLILAKVSLKKLTFICPCRTSPTGDPKCSKVYTYTLSLTGSHHKGR